MFLAFVLTDVCSYLQTNYLEVIGAILSLICVWLNTKAHIGGWLFGILSTGVYAWVAWEAQLYGFFILNLFFLVLSIYGWLHWRFGFSNTQEAAISRLSGQTQAIYLLVGATMTIGFAYLLAYFGGKFVWVDATTSAFSMVAQWLLARKKLENWLLWVVVNIVYCYLFLLTSYWVSLGLYFCLLILAVQGWLTWRKMLLDSHTNLQHRTAQH